MSMPRETAPQPLSKSLSIFLIVMAAAIAAVGTPVARAQTFTILHEFKSGPHDGQDPIYGSLTLDAVGNLYGVSSLGGSGSCSGGCGTLFKLTPDRKLTVLYSFGANSVDGKYPYGSLIRDDAGNFYGTTSGGGTSGAKCNNYGCGTVYKVTPSGKETVLYNFSGGVDGATPNAGLVRDAAGNLYGTTFVGGAHNWGTVFKVDPTGHETVLHNFNGRTQDGGDVLGGLVSDSAGNLYGATFGGGLPGCALGGDIGCGTIYKITTSGVETVLYRFNPNSAEGTNPEEERLLLDGAGNLYGTNGGNGSQSPGGLGTIFKLDITGTLTVLHDFTGGLGGAGSVAGLVSDSSGNLYGTPDLGGGTQCFQGCGIVFELATDGTFTTLHSFSGGADGRQPWGLAIDGAGNLYGATGAGGIGDATLYEITP